MTNEQRESWRSLSLRGLTDTTREYDVNRESTRAKRTFGRTWKCDRRVLHCHCSLIARRDARYSSRDKITREYALERAGKLNAVHAACVSHKV